MTKLSCLEVFDEFVSWLACLGELLIYFSEVVFSIAVPLNSVFLSFESSPWGKESSLPYRGQRGQVVTALPKQKRAKWCRDIQVTSAAGTRC